MVWIFELDFQSFLKYIGVEKKVVSQRGMGILNIKGNKIVDPSQVHFVFQGPFMGITFFFLFPSKKNSPPKKI